MKQERQVRRSLEHFNGFLHALYRREEPFTFRLPSPPLTRQRGAGEWSEGYRFGRRVR